MRGHRQVQNVENLETIEARMNETEAAWPVGFEHVHDGPRIELRQADLRHRFACPARLERSQQPVFEVAEKGHAYHRALRSLRAVGSRRRCSVPLHARLNLPLLLYVPRHESRPRKRGMSRASTCPGPPSRRVRRLARRWSGFALAAFAEVSAAERVGFKSSLSRDVRTPLHNNCGCARRARMSWCAPTSSGWRRSSGSYSITPSGSHALEIPSSRAQPRAEADCHPNAALRRAISTFLRDGSAGPSVRHCGVRGCA